MDEPGSAANIFRDVQTRSENLHKWEIEMKMTLDEKNRELQEAKRAMDDLRSQLTDKSSYTSSLEQKVSELKNKSKEAAEERDLVTELADRTGSEVEILQNACKIQEQGISYLMELVATLEENFKSVEMDFEKLKNENCQTIRRLETSLKEKETENRNRFEQYQDVKEKLEEELEAVNKKLNDKVAEIKSSVEELKTAKTLLKETHDRLIETQKDFNSAAKDSALLVSELEDQNSKLKDENTAMDLEIDQRKKDLQIASLKNARLAEQCREYRDHLETITKELEGLSESALGFKSHLSELTEQQHSAEMKIASVQNLLSQRTSDLETALEAKRKQQEIVSHLEAELKSVENCAEQLLSLQQKFAAMQILNEKHEVEQAALREELTEALKDREENLIPQVNSLENTCSHLQKENEDLTLRLQNEVAQKDQLNQEVERISKLKDSAVQEATDIASELCKLKDELEELKKSKVLDGGQKKTPIPKAPPVKTQMAARIQSRYRQLPTRPTSPATTTNPGASQTTPKPGISGPRISGRSVTRNPGTPKTPTTKLTVNSLTPTSNGPKKSGPSIKPNPVALKTPTPKHAALSLTPANNGPKKSAPTAPVDNNKRERRVLIPDPTSPVRRTIRGRRLMGDE